MKGKHITGLDCDAPAEEMIRHALRAQVAAMCAMRKKALDWSNPEGVHDMRVLSRRLRSSIADFEPYLPGTRLPLTKLRVIARTLGKVRDEDVALAALEKFKTEEQDVVTEGLDFLIAERRMRRDTARLELQKAIRRGAIKELREQFETQLNQPTESAAAPQLGEQSEPQPNQPADSSEGTELREHFESWLNQPAESGEHTKSREQLEGQLNGPIESGAAEASEPVRLPPTFRSIGVRVISARLKELRAASPHIFFPDDNKDLHDLRLLAKGLRYAIELFAVCWGEADMRAIAGEVAKLQTSLGELHDCDVWMAELGARLKRTARPGQTDPQIIRINTACTSLLSHFVKLRTEHYRDALGRWQQWQGDGLLNNLKSRLGRPESE